MKKVAAALVLFLLSSVVVVAQGHCGSGSSNHHGGNGGSGSGGSGSGSGYHGGGSQSHAQQQASPYQNWPPPVRAWLENGAQGAIPQLLVARVRIEARPWLVQTFGLSLGQIAQLYQNGAITITYIPVAPPTPELHFGVAYGGGLLIVELDDEL